MPSEVQSNTPKKRGRKSSKERRKGYFYEEEEEAFNKYIQSSDKAERDRIFRDKLYPAFTKMIESIIRRYGLFTPNENFEDTFYDTMSFLMTKVNNFDSAKGYKVYSYCGTICKNYLIYKRTQYMKQIQRQSSYDAVFNNGDKDNHTNDESKLSLISFNTELIENTIDEIKYIINNKDNTNAVVTENEVKVGYGLVEILTNWEDIFKQTESKKFNKTSFLFFMKEYTRLSTKEVREAMKRFKDLYFFTKQKLLA